MLVNIFSNIVFAKKLIPISNITQTMYVNNHQMEAQFSKYRYMAVIQLKMRCSMRLRSGDLAGHSMRSIPLFSRNFDVTHPLDGDLFIHYCLLFCML